MNLSIRHYGGCLGLILLGACANVDAPAATISEAVAQAAVQTTKAATAAERIEADVIFLADDAREGREAGTSGYQEAADYVSVRMAEIGLEPAGVDGWFQQVPLRANTPILERAAFSVTKADGETVDLTHLDDFRVFVSADRTEMDITAPAVFVGFGVHAPDQGHDDYAGLDVKGKTVVYIGGAPDRFDSEQRAHYSSRGGKADAAAKHGAVGIVSLFSIAGEKRFSWARLISNPTRVGMTWVHPDGRVEVSGAGIAGGGVLNPEISQILFDGAEKTFADIRAEAEAEGVSPAGFDLNVTISMQGAQTAKDVTSPNVVALIPGSDPDLKDEYIVLSAHLDHTGIDQKKIDAGEDGINNGAFDNAMGVATMLEAATRLRAASLGRSVLILAVTAEEKGLLGADYFAHYPTVDGDGLAANVNLDMPVVLHRFTDVIAFGAERSSLGPIVRAAAAKMDITLSPDPMPEQNLFVRSDHYRFVEKGVPAVFLVVGFANGGEEKINDFRKNHYHKPSDDTSLPILYDEAARFAEVNYMIAKDLANAEERPHWNEGDFFGELFSKK
ncbi:MAG: M28 family peptidase [Alphaproteobacteria bacterium]|nr:M28 family peptidase [Alphaproteobacteria bacterium]